MLKSSYFKDEYEVRQYMHGVSVDAFTVHPDLSVTCEGEVQLTPKSQGLVSGEIPVQFRETGTFMCTGASSLSGVPSVVHGDFWLTTYYGSSIDAFPERIEGSLRLLRTSTLKRAAQVQLPDN